ncbi:NADP-dependent oxidoreductase [Lysinibacillus xylanilyticus]|uniref:NADP-dependent oxidoreductase n=1 Tax=Lysinibacillus xylanilyticus TaxID=582475 RepID=UPI00083C9CDB|nr:NADP-dependent oxidoreductase [Lysinibacillus xylanilyticus]
MNAAVIHRYGQKNLELTKIEIPKISSDDLLVEIHAASINPIDYKVRDGKVKMLLSYKMPLVLGNDFSGVIVKVGKSVTEFQVGDEVYGRPRKSRIGTFAEYIAIHKDDIAIKPKNLSFEEAAAIPLIGLTTYQAFYDIMQIKPNDKVLIQAGSGGVGTFAIQLAKLMGAYVATTTSSRNEALVKRLGADKVINYKNENFEDILSDYDYVYDTLGGEALQNSFKILKPGGKIVSLSGTPNYRFAKAYGLNLWKSLLLKFATRKLTDLEKQYEVEYHFLFMKPSGTQLEIIREFIEAKKIVPIIDRVVLMDDIQKAFEYSESGRAKGKVIVKIK